MPKNKPNSTSLRARAVARQAKSGITAKKVREIVKGVAETKYVVSREEQQNEVTLLANLTTPASWFPAMPRIIQGSGSNERDGQKITSVIVKSHFSFHFDFNEVDTQDIFVKVFYGTNKTIRSLDQIANMGVGSLLDPGNQTSIDWLYNAPFTGTQLDMMRTQSEVWKLKVKKFRLTRNQGLTNNGAAALTTPNVGGLLSKQFTMTTKHKGVVLYDSLNGTANPLIFPTNFAPMYACVGWRPNGDDPDAPGQDFPIRWTARHEMYFKDV